ncbi:MAG: hypothetical protein DRH06_11545 [Deltaproteobacteria bacterium]|nr:MAG: hypothetical protein DRH06_11545 [Deltaproteobacteria bacterium]
MKDCWDKSLIFFQIAGILVIPAVIAYFGWKVDSTLQKNDIKIKYIEIAVEILKDPPKEETKALRLWAVDVLSEYPTIKFTSEALIELKKSPLPAPIFLLNPDGTKLLNPDDTPFTQPNM